jgi:penicillin-binding protein 1A
MMFLKRIIPIILSVVFVLTCLSGCKSNEPSVQRVLLKDINGEVFFDSSGNANDNIYSAYVDVVKSELTRINFDKTVESVTVQTSFDPDLQKSCLTAYENGELSGTPFSTVITSVDGRIFCAVSCGDKEKNLATEKTQPYSAFKPLSVYTPALENGVINWADTFMDAPVKQIENEDGVYENWPENGNGRYSEKETSLGDSIKLSLNTTAVRCLQKTGVSTCVDFVSEKFGIDVAFEREQIALRGEEEVLHNIGLGYLMGGVSPIDMAGYYQIFATGGRYTSPYSVLEICDADGNVLYKKQDESRQLITEETAFIMNALLQKPFERGGTAEKAYIEGIQLGGKTGTGTDFVGNWLVCFSPEYCISVWHGPSIRNKCTEIFADFSDNLNFDASKNFPDCANVKRKVYCEESGKGFTINCNSMADGYFLADTVLEKCPLHS